MMVRFLEIQGPNCRETLYRPLPKATLSFFLSFFIFEDPT